MELNQRTAALLVIVGFIVAFAGAWGFGVFEGPAPAPQASAPVETVSEPEPAATEAAESAPVEVEDVFVPAFDLVRVEGDGSILIAGRAERSASVEIITGASVIGSTMANDAGEFVFVLDDPLKPGDYQVVLRATATTGLVAMSKETAILSIPDRPDGQVLALVEQPGQPSKLITVPEPEMDVALAESEVAEAENGQAEAASEEPEAPIAALPGEPSDVEQRQAAEPTAEQAGSETDMAGASAESAPDGIAEAEPADGAQAEVATADREIEATPEAPVAVDAADEAADPEMEADANETETVIAQEVPASETDTPIAAAPAPEAGISEVQAEATMPTAEADTTTASASGEEQEEEVAVAAAPAPGALAPRQSAVDGTPTRIAVQAVEIEGRQIFVAGLAEPDHLVRVYANEIFLGETVSSPGARFLVETIRDLAVGDYIVRADLLDRAGTRVIARAAVPFEREAGEMIAAIAPEVSGRAMPERPGPVAVPVVPETAEGAEPELETPTPAVPGLAATDQSTEPADGSASASPDVVIAEDDAEPDTPASVTSAAQPTETPHPSADMAEALPAAEAVAREEATESAARPIAPAASEVTATENIAEPVAEAAQQSTETAEAQAAPESPSAEDVSESADEPISSAAPAVAATEEAADPVVEAPAEAAGASTEVAEAQAVPVEEATESSVEPIAPGTSEVAVAEEVAPPVAEVPASDPAPAQPAATAQPSTSEANVAEQIQPAEVTEPAEVTPSAPVEIAPAIVVVPPAESAVVDAAVAEAGEAAHEPVESQPSEPEPVDTAVQPAPMPTQPMEVAAVEPRSVQVPEPASDEAVSPPTVTAAPLQSVDGSVIIRRGDSLWRISRRVYGRGVRYSTIYLANQEQIADPDRIWPGQVFRLPERTEQGEEADLSRIGDRVIRAE